MPMSSGNQVTTLPAGLEVARGSIDKLALKGRTAVNTAVGATYESVWNVGGIRHNIAYDTATTVTAVSTSSDDTNSGGSGAKRVKIRGIDGSGALVEENLNLAGTVAVTSVNSYLSIDKVTCNKGAANVGTIDIKDGSDIVQRIDAGDGESMAPHWYCPADSNSYLTSFLVGSSEPALVSIWARKASVNGPWAKKIEIVVKNSVTTYQLPNPIQLEAQFEFEFRAKRLGDTDSAVSIDYQVIVESN